MIYVVNVAHFIHCYWQLTDLKYSVCAGKGSFLFWACFVP